MFNAENVFSSFSANDLAAARSFYQDVLGLDVTTNAMGFIDLHLPGGASVLVYEKPTHSPASFTVLNFLVDDVDAAVEELVGRGVTMEHYDEMPQDANGVMRGNGPDIAWFADPAGNVLALIKNEELPA